MCVIYTFQSSRDPISNSPHFVTIGMSSFSIDTILKDKGGETLNNLVPGSWYLRGCAHAFAD